MQQSNARSCFDLKFENSEQNFYTATLMLIELLASYLFRHVLYATECILKTDNRSCYVCMSINLALIVPCAWVWYVLMSCSYQCIIVSRLFERISNLHEVQMETSVLICHF